MGMLLSIHAAGTLPPIEQEELEDMLERVFVGQDEGLQWSSTDWNVIVKLDGVIASNVEILTRVITVGDQPLRIGGIGGVATLPEYRGRGLASQAMHFAAAYMRDHLGLEFALLVCAENRTSLYESLGWQVVPGPMFFDQPGGKQKFNAAVMILSLTGKPWSPGEIYLRGLPW